ncbi:MAG: calcium-transporting P-type ATPase, PMR1-type [Bacillota bacterium]
MQDRGEFYRIPEKKLINIFETSVERGLSSRESKKRLKKYGINILPEKNNKNIVTIFMEQFKDFMILVLLAATILSFLMGEFSDSITIFAIIIMNAIMGFVQEYRAEKSLAALKQLTTPEARVIRDNKNIKVNARELVPGDIIILKTGDKVPADARIIEAEGLQANESVLTGESVPVNKNDQLLYANNLALQNQKNMIFMGSIITRGNTKAMVVRTGKSTEMGKIADLLEEENYRITPLQKRLKHLGKWLVASSVLITFLIMLVGVLKGQSYYQMFMAGVSLAVAAIPEGLPAIVTLALAIGVQKMIKKNAIVRKLPAVETLGCATVICSDKTGTLTQNKMSLEKVYINHRIADFNSNLNNLVGKQDINKLMVIGALCNSAVPREKEKKGTFQKVKKIFTREKLPELMGDPTDIALVNAIYEKKLSLPELHKNYEVLKEMPFESQRKRMSVLVKNKEDTSKELWIKGAPEVILKKCDYVLIDGKKTEINKDLEKEIIEAANSMADKALRVIALAYKNVSEVKNRELKDMENNLIFTGLSGLKDPPRSEVYQAVKNCKKAGIKPVMITGDHRLTARVIGKEIGIIENRKGNIETGEKVNQCSDSELEELVQNTSIFARISPQDKLRIVKAYQRNDEIVAMTGDGVNDAPAVKEADIGVAMGENGTDVTREVSSLILRDDNFATIVAAIKQGRQIYNNIRKFIRYLLSCNIGELLTIFIGIILGLPLPLLPIQILWVNLVTDGLPALALGMEESEDEIMNKPPREPDESIFAQGMVPRILSQGILIGLSTIFVFLIAIYRLESGIITARTMAFSTLVFSQLFFVFSCRSETKSLWKLNPLGNTYLIGAVLISVIMQLLVIYHPFFNELFQTTILENIHWVIVMVFSVWSTILLEIIQNIIKRVTYTGEVHLSENYFS